MQAISKTDSATVQGPEWGLADLQELAGKVQGKGKLRAQLNGVKVEAHTFRGRGERRT